MLFDSHLLLMFVPILFFLHTAVGIYGRNPRRLENRAASVVMAFLALLFMINFAQLIVAKQHLQSLMATLKYPVMLLSGGASLCLHLIFTRKYHRIPLAVGIIATLITFVFYEIQLILHGSSYFIEAVKTNNSWSMEQPSAVLYGYLSVLGAFASASLALAYVAWRRSDVRIDRDQMLKLLSANLYFFATSIVCVLAVAIVLPNGTLPSLFLLLPAIVWGIAVSLMMITSDNMPSLSTKYEVLFRMAPAPILIFNQHARILEVNPQAQEMFGNDIEGSHLDCLAAYFESKDIRLLQEIHASGLSNLNWQSKEMTIRVANGDFKIVLVDLEVISENGEPYAIAIIRDITLQRNIEKQTAFLAKHDLLTALPNRASFNRALEAALRDNNGESVFNAVLLVDLDRFKLINDTLGHQSGDEVIKVIAGRFRACLHDDVLLARAGGDEFMVMVRGATEYDEIIRIAEELKAVLHAPVQLFGYEYHMTASIGISLFPGDGETVDAIIKNTDIAMYHAKSNGGNQYRFFSKELNASIKRMVDMEASLRKALDAGEFYVMYQPQIDIISGEIIGAEALVRWNSKDYGMVPPLDFIPLAEQTGLILKLGQWVLEEACREAKRWEQGGHESMTVSVNVSAKQFMQPDFVDVVKGVLEETGLDPRKLCLEITESVVIDKLMFTLKMLDELVSMGIEISMDDFGTGYSSLSILRQLPINVIKIDKSFIAEMIEAESVRSVVAAMITMTHQLGKKIVAEGIEYEQQLIWLKEMGCNIGQGYYFDKPLSADLMQAKLKQTS